MQSLEALRAELNRYAISGDSTRVLTLVENNKKNFSGLHFHAVLNKITVELLDLNKKVPQNYNHKTKRQGNTLERHERAKAILSDHEMEHEQYVKAVNKLYGLIDDMEKKWPETNSLTDKLRQDIDQFVASHPISLPTEKAYNDFKAHFSARLHSEDEVLSTHRAAWKTNLANFAIGLFTLGVALGIKLVHSKLSEGHYSLFFSKTGRQKQTSLMEQVVEKNLVAVAAAV